MSHETHKGGSEFSNAASRPREGMVSDILHFMRNTRWWLTPIILAIMLAGILVIFGSSAVAPFIYPLF
jgi:hypothetical protein